MPHRIAGGISKGDVTDGTDNSVKAAGYLQFEDLISKVYPLGSAAPVNIISSATANTYGAYVEVVPVTTITKDILIMGFILYDQNPGNGKMYVMDIATGAGGSEVHRASSGGSHGRVSDVGYNEVAAATFPIPIKVAANTRIAMRVADTTANANHYHMRIVYIEKS